MSIRVGIVGYGNLARGVESELSKNKDMVLSKVFTRRDPSSVVINTKGVEVASIDDILNYKDEIDILILCGGSAFDLPKQTPELARNFNVIDSFDTHKNIPSHFEACDKASKEAHKISLISCGWDPGMFSLNRLLMSAILPDGKDYTFWGKGVSQGHSDAIRNVPGVKNGKQYTVPVEETLDEVRAGLNKDYTARQMHNRVCYVVAEDGADLPSIEKTIKEMPNYFADYNTTVHFISEEEFNANHNKLNHGGFVIRSGNTGNGNKHIIEYSLKLDSNPEFTASVILCYARAAYKMYLNGDSGCKTVLDVPPYLLSPLSPEEQRAHLL